LSPRIPRPGTLDLGVRKRREIQDLPMQTRKQIAFAYL